MSAVVGSKREEEATRRVKMAIKLRKRAGSGPLSHDTQEQDKHTHFDFLRFLLKILDLVLPFLLEPLNLSLVAGVLPL